MFQWKEINPTKSKSNCIKKLLKDCIFDDWTKCSTLKKCRLEFEEKYFLFSYFKKRDGFWYGKLVNSSGNWDDFKNSQMTPH